MAVEKGREAPGPTPFTPLELTVDTEQQKEIVFCALDDGWTRLPGESTPATERTVVPARAVLVPADGRWIVSAVYFIPTDPPDCGEIMIQEVLW
jgi:hypothetical protein